MEVSVNEDDESVEGKPITKSGIEEARKAIQTLENISLFLKFREATMKSLKEINYNVEKEDLSIKKQALTSNFFPKK